MLNFRKLKQDFSSSIVKEGRDLYDRQKVVSAKLLHLDTKTMRIAAKVLGQFDNCYESEIEIDRMDCQTIDSDCDCPYNYDCQHLAAVLFYLEEHIDKILVAFSKENDFKQTGGKSAIDKEEKKKLLEKIKEAESKEVQRQEEHYQKQLLQEYVISSQLLAASPFFRSHEKQEFDRAEFALIFNPSQEGESKGIVEVQIALRLPFRSKPLYIPQIKPFIDALKYEESIFIGGKKYNLSLKSFDPSQQEIVRMVRDQARFSESANSERALTGGPPGPRNVWHGACQSLRHRITCICKAGICRSGRGPSRSIGSLRRDDGDSAPLFACAGPLALFIGIYQASHVQDFGQPACACRRGRGDS